MIREYYKLVRNNVPVLIVKNGNRPFFQVIEDDDLYKLELENKFKEKSSELLTSYSEESFVDLLEVMDALASARGTSFDSLLKKKEETQVQEGSYDKKIFLNKVEVI